jgi:hypothetical protein
MLAVVVYLFILVNHFTRDKKNLANIFLAKYQSGIPVYCTLGAVESKQRYDAA